MSAFGTVLHAGPWRVDAVLAPLTIRVISALITAWRALDTSRVVVKAIYARIAVCLSARTCLTRDLAETAGHDIIDH